MNLQAFDAADNAVKKLAKDYKPVTDLAASLDEIRVMLNEVGNLEAANKQARTELVKVRAEKDQADGELTAVRKAVANEQAILERVRKAVSDIKTNLSQG